MLDLEDSCANGLSLLSVLQLLGVDLQLTSALDYLGNVCFEGGNEVGLGDDAGVGGHDFGGNRILSEQLIHNGSTLHFPINDGFDKGKRNIGIKEHAGQGSGNLIGFSGRNHSKDCLNKLVLSMEEKSYQVECRCRHPWCILSKSKLDQ